MEFVAVAGDNRSEIAWDAEGRHQECEKRAAASRAGNNQIFIERSFHGSRVGNLKDRIGWLKVVCDSNARLGLPGDGEAVVQITANAEVKAPVPNSNRVLDVHGQFFNVRMSMELVRRTSGYQVVGRKNRACRSAIHRLAARDHAGI